MTNRELLEIAMEQSAEDNGCRASDFLGEENVVVPFRRGAKARKYIREPIACNFISYGNNVVAAAMPEALDLAREYVGRYAFYHCFETPNMHWLNEQLMERGFKICFMAEYFLPDVDRLARPECALELRVLEQADFEGLYVPEWSNALCADRRELDVLGVGAYDGARLVGLAGCSADCESMWQIGVDVLPDYRRRGIASAMTAALAREILSRGKTPFYCSAWSNLRSVKNALRSGFAPAWVEMTAKPASLVDGLNAEETRQPDPEPGR